MKLNKEQKLDEEHECVLDSIIGTINIHKNYCDEYIAYIIGVMNSSRFRPNFNADIIDQE